ncbi:MAG: VWA domain-containing protein [Deltaproteobacteria bacterium]|nr:MAG: VWA domain-containing protein [Deltaproteobacteria bacterium]
MKKMVLGLLWLVAALSLSACAGMNMGSTGSAFTPANLSTGTYQAKVDNAAFILDASATMVLESGEHFTRAKQMLASFNQSVPADVRFNGALLSFGHHASQSSAASTTAWGPAPYDKAAFARGLDGIKAAGGNSPLAHALFAAADQLKAAGGKSAIVIVSDGMQMANAPAAARHVVEKLNGNVCIYTVFEGNSAAGRSLLEQVADASSCGGTVDAASLQSSAGMGAFVKQVLLTERPVAKAAPQDSDGDGVLDDRDKCPDTPRGEFVDEDGCSLKLTLHINFDFDKADIKPEFKDDLDRAAAFIKKHSQVPYILIAGHTDHTGDAAYNQKLSEDRARAVRDYLVANYGIDGKRLLVKGYGKSRPVATNKTKEGRYQNRRVEVVCCILPPE